MEHADLYDDPRLLLSHYLAKDGVIGKEAQNLLDKLTDEEVANYIKSYQQKANVELRRHLDAWVKKEE